MKLIQDDHANVWKGVAAGLVGGLVASWTMNQVFSVWSKVKQSDEEPEQSAKKGENTDPATLKLAKRTWRQMFHTEIPDEHAKKAEAGVHYGFGTVMGAVYGGVAEYMPQARAGFGTGFATALFLTADEIAVPAMGLSGKPNEVPAESHVLGFAAHLVYGLTTEVVRRGARRILAA